MCDDLGVDPAGPRTLRTLLVQADAVARDIDANIGQIRQAVTEHPEAELAILPELFVSGYESEQLDELAIPTDGSVIRELQGICREFQTALVAGYVERSSGRPYNSMIMIDDDGSIAGNYRKTHLFGAERTAFEPGERLECVRLCGVLIAPMICFDVEIPEVARQLCQEDPDVIVTIAANMAPFLDDHTLSSRARALDNRTPHVYVNRAGDGAGFEFVGGSRVIDGGGQVLVDLGPAERAEIFDVPLRVSAPDELDYRRHLRPALYSVQSQTESR